MVAQLERTLIGAYIGGADLGEALATAHRVPAGDYAAWHDEWNKTAVAAQQSAERAVQQGLQALASHAYLRASEYSRQSYFFLRHDLSDDRVSNAYRTQRQCFRLAMSLVPFSVEPISIDFGPIPLNGYMFRPDSSDDAPRPTVLFPGGFDSTCEEMFKYGAHCALDMGWNAVTWDGPGQGGQLIEHGVTMRPDFESVLTPVVNWALSQSCVSAESLALVGRSLWGLFGASRREPRASSSRTRR